MFTVCNFKNLQRNSFCCGARVTPRWFVIVKKLFWEIINTRQRTTTVELLLNITSHMQCSLDFGVGNFFSFVVWSFLLFDTFKSFVSPDRNMQFIFTIHFTIVHGCKHYSPISSQVFTAYFWTSLSILQAMFSISDVQCSPSEFVGMVKSSVELGKTSQVNQGYGSEGDLFAFTC